MGLFGKKQEKKPEIKVAKKGMKLLKKEEVYKPVFQIQAKPSIPVLPEVEDKTKLNVRYPLIAPFAYAHIYWDAKNNELVYMIEEPNLSPNEVRILNFLEDGIKELINISFIGVKEGDTIIKYLEKNINVLLDELGVSITKDSYLKIMYYIYRDFVGLNELEPLMNDYYIEDVECNGVNSPIYIVHRKYRNLRTNIVYTSMDKLTNFVEKLAQKCGKYISYASPLLDGALPDGSRVNATYTQEITSKGPTYTVRKFTKEPWTPTKLMQFGTISAEMLAYLWLLIEYESNIMIIGGTASGKTTLLNGMAFFIPPQARIVSIEDTKELNLLHENWLPSIARAGAGATMITGEKFGEVTLFDLLRASFRQRPDYVIVGEIRGKEAFVLFQGMSSGHPSFGTFHAEDLGTMIRRLETPPISLGPTIVNSLDAVCVMGQVKVKGKPSRRVKSIVEIIDISEKIGDYKSNTPFSWNPRTDNFSFTGKSHMFNKLVNEFGVSPQKLMMEYKLRTRLLLEMYKKGIFDYKPVYDVINAYYKNPIAVLRRFRLVR